MIVNECKLRYNTLDFQSGNAIIIVDPFTTTTNRL